MLAKNVTDELVSWQLMATACSMPPPYLQTLFFVLHPLKHMTADLISAQQILHSSQLIVILYVKQSYSANIDARCFKVFVSLLHPPVHENTISVKMHALSVEFVLHIFVFSCSFSCS